MQDTAAVEASLNSFDPLERERALRELGQSVRMPEPSPRLDVNMHAHSFFSYNADGASPSRIAYEARRLGLYAAGLCDFDVLDGLEEFLGAGRILGLRCTVNLETRAYVRDFAGVDINSPGEHGVAYVMGAGFAALPPPGSPEDRGLEELRERAKERNLALVARIAAAVPEIPLDYERDVLPLTPAGVATERHIVEAWVERALHLLGTGDRAAAFFAGLLDIPRERAEQLSAARVELEGAVRSRLAKRGGIAYAPPDEATFPSLERFVAWVRTCGAIPLTTWLDGTSAGESDPDRLLDYMHERGARGVNIIPDRNWNVSDEQDRKTKVEHLRRMVGAADRRELPINIGTELNKAGLPFVDDLDGPVLKDMKRSFLRGARVFVGHTVLLRYCGYSYIGADAEAEFGDDGAARNRLFESVGSLEPVDERVDGELRRRDREAALAVVRDSAEKGRWMV